MKNRKNVGVRNHQVILNLIQDLQRLPLLFLNNLRGRSRIKYGMTSLCNNGWEAGEPRQRPLGMTPNLTGFTLIELLGVVLIIGILATVAVPQYQVAVMKARITGVIPLVRALAVAEEMYYLANGEYTVNLEELDIEMPKGKNCTVVSGSDTKCYECDDLIIGVYNGLTNAQGGIGRGGKIRYLEFFGDYEGELYLARKGDRICLARGEVARKTCHALGPGKEDEDYNGVWDYMYRFDK